MFPDFLDQEADVVARKLLGCELVRELDGERIRVKIVETESYDQQDQASHTFNGETKRNAVMFGQSGHLYVYFTYGMHYCCNVVTGKQGLGSAVLIRAVEPLTGESVLAERRNKTGVDISNGPAKLCQALGIDKHLNGHDLRESPLRLIVKDELNPEYIVITTRIGISQAKDDLKRWYIKGNKYVSRA
jgi:DNA-3-methyladenine glycosylase